MKKLLKVFIDRIFIVIQNYIHTRSTYYTMYMILDVSCDTFWKNLKIKRELTQKVPLFIWISLGRLPVCSHLADLDFISQIKKKREKKTNIKIGRWSKKIEKCFLAFIQTTSYSQIGKVITWTNYANVKTLVHTASGSCLVVSFEIEEPEFFRLFTRSPVR